MATPRQVSATEAARVQPEQEQVPAPTMLSLACSSARTRSRDAVAQSYRPVLAGVFAAGESLLSHWADVVRGENGYH